MREIYSAFVGNCDNDNLLSCILIVLAIVGWHWQLLYEM